MLKLSLAITLIKPPPMVRHKLAEREWKCLVIDLMKPFPTSTCVILDILIYKFTKLEYPRSIGADNIRSSILKRQQIAHINDLYYLKEKGKLLLMFNFFMALPEDHCLN